MLDIRRRTGYLFLAVMLGHVILISAQVQDRGGAALLSAVTFGVVSRIQLATASAVDSVRGVFHNYVWLRGARTENETLRRQAVELGGQLEEQRARAAQVVMLEEALALRQSLPIDTIAARVIAGDPTPGFPAVTIDRGSADGIRANMAVIAPRGVVGRIYGGLEEHAAQVQLIVGRSAGAAAYLERTGGGGNIIGGAQNPPLRLDDVPNLVDVQIGDLVLTSGLDGIFPRGYTLGRVERAERGSGTYREIAVRPTVDFSNLQYVLVVTSPPSPRWAAEADKQ
ncbi:MAG TPA: rod shape-determining protein MreC [Vicinamibacterales bacterium]|nr:rod shape-determining protein MreC [Vicinamibacterales bacterium]